MRKTNNSSKKRACDGIYGKEWLYKYPAVDIRHTNAIEFLERDIKNITRFFVKRGLTVENPIDIIKRITK